MENGTKTPSDSVETATEGHSAQDMKKTDNDAGQGGHRRSVSGSILGSLPFLRSSTKDAPPRDAARDDGEQPRPGSESSKRGSSIANALRQRKRKGSLRKTAMLGTGKLLRERRNSVRTSSKPAMPAAQIDPVSPDDETTPRRFSYENPSQNSSSDSGWPSTGKLTVFTTGSGQSLDAREHLTPRMLASPLTSPVGPYASTTDDDEGLTFFRQPASGSSSYSAMQLQPGGPTPSLPRRRSNRAGQQSSLTIVQTPAELAVDDEWDYSETEWWGWVVLVATWIVFVVGMGSCLGVWSWAWDVGETPYAPPELEDDATLPITGYYPALMVCTAVMAWVWVVVAWVGMKYFRHAKEG
ncbi:hypothetical protein K491DRAFT_588938 [Lophiostoma macrostomum CBS 122681]|uniref:Uncharacterized protein n=1 Tax=Lophiostoma macrostomum CBS 122681 TaxID=1314788 RepID=A0A6A6TK96_9PLEO|nr:hypothetical protein K491DRAFT_588938 [Lophiostoma macrostomum CBS 122681]